MFRIDWNLMVDIVNKIVIALVVVIALLYFGGDKVTGIVSGISNEPPSFLVPLIDKATEYLPFISNEIFMGIKLWAILLMAIGVIVALSFFGY